MILTKGEYVVPSNLVSGLNITEPYRKQNMSLFGSHMPFSRSLSLGTCINVNLLK